MRSAVLHVVIPLGMIAALSRTSVFSDVHVDLTYEHYAEERLDYLPAVVAMPCNCLVNVGYFLVGLYWLFWGGYIQEREDSRYLREVFAVMAICYAPVQWTRLATLQRAPAVLDQWVTLPIFAWVPAWIDHIEDLPRRWRSRRAAALELCSVLSYGLALAHELGFEAALACHVTFAVYKGVRVQVSHGDDRSRRHLLQAMASCAGFVGLKLLDHRLSEFWLFQRFTGHFWSKVCDVLQFHYSFCFLTTVTRRAQTDKTS